jgi:hypothetical protein
MGFAHPCMFRCKERKNHNMSKCSGCGQMTYSSRRPCGLRGRSRTGSDRKFRRYDGPSFIVSRVPKERFSQCNYHFRDPEGGRSCSGSRAREKADGFDGDMTKLFAEVTSVAEFEEFSASRPARGPA